MSTRLYAVMLTGLAGTLFAWGCDVVPVEGQMVVCQREWSCGDTLVSESEQSFCTDPSDASRQERIDAYIAEFADTCDGVTVRCVDTTTATCAATCAFSSACDVADAEYIRL